MAKGVWIPKAIHQKSNLRKALKIPADKPIPMKSIE